MYDEKHAKNTQTTRKTRKTRNKHAKNTQLGECRIGLRHVRTIKVRQCLEVRVGTVREDRRVIGRAHVRTKGAK